MSAGRLFVRISNDKIIVPFEAERTVEELAREASARYMRLVKRRSTPADQSRLSEIENESMIVELRSGGASLDYDDIVGSVLSPGEEVQAFLKTAPVENAWVMGAVPGSSQVGWVQQPVTNEVQQQQQGTKRKYIGSDNVGMRKRVQKKTFEEAKAFAESLGLKSQADYIEWSNKGLRPPDMPRNPNKYYKDKGWTSWRDFLGTHVRPFDEAREYVRRLGLKNQTEYKEWSKAGMRPVDIPGNPYNFYRDKGWISFPDFLGTERGKAGKQWRVPFKSYHEAKKFMKTQGLKSRDDFFEWCKSGIRTSQALDIPSNPPKAYQDRGWVSWDDFLSVNEQPASAVPVGVAIGVLPDEHGQAAEAVPVSDVEQELQFESMSNMVDHGLHGDHDKVPSGAHALADLSQGHSQAPIQQAHPHSLAHPHPHPHHMLQSHPLQPHPLQQHQLQQHQLQQHQLQPHQLQPHPHSLQH
eukprot:jgi/Chlat1/3674/Chrsp24S00280